MLKKIAAVEGFKYSECLTGLCIVFEVSKSDWKSGFKNIGNEAIRLKNFGFDVVFAYEEALGYMIGDRILDKDGISATVTVIDLRFPRLKTTYRYALPSWSITWRVWAWQCKVIYRNSIKSMSFRCYEIVAVTFSQIWLFPGLFLCSVRWYLSCGNLDQKWLH